MEEKSLQPHSHRTLLSHQCPQTRRGMGKATCSLSNEAFHFGHSRTVTCKVAKLESDSWADLIRKTKQNKTGIDIEFMECSTGKF